MDHKHSLVSKNNIYHHLLVLIVIVRAVAIAAADQIVGRRRQGSDRGGRHRRVTLPEGGRRGRRRQAWLFAIVGWLLFGGLVSLSSQLEPQLGRQEEGERFCEAKSSDLPGDAVSENGIIRSVKLKEGQEVKG